MKKIGNLCNEIVLSAPTHSTVISGDVISNGSISASSIKSDTIFTHESEETGMSLTKEDKEVLEDVGNRIVHKMIHDDAIFECDGITKITVKMKDGEYRKKAILAGTKFYLDSSYVGKQESLIFVLTPLEDLGDIAKVEIGMRDGDGFFPLMGGQIASAFGLRSVESLHRAVLMITDLAKEEREEMKIEDEEIMTNNPLWGAF